MAISQFGLGTAQNTSTSTLSLASLSVTSTNCIVVIVVERNATGATGTVADSALNTYGTPISYPLDGSTANGVVQIFWAPNNTALSSGSITYTKAVSGSKTAMSIFYLTGCDTVAPVRQYATAKTDYAAATNPSTTINGIRATDFVVGVCGGDGTGSSFTEDTFFIGINTEIKTGTTSTDARINPGYQQSSGTSMTRAPTFNASATGTQILAAFITPGTGGSPTGFFNFFGGP